MVVVVILFKAAVGVIATKHGDFLESDLLTV